MARAGTTTRESSSSSSIVDSARIPRVVVPHIVAKRRMRVSPSTWVQLAFVALLVLAALAWKHTALREWTDPERLADAIEPYRANPISAPVVLAVFVVAELFLFPVLVLVFVCGLAFVPWLGAIYALAGAVASAVVSFLIGRRLGRERLERWGGRFVRGLEKVLQRRGVVAVFLVRKIPAPFTLVNMVCGASPVSLRDFVIGTILGMGTGIILITFLGGQLLEIARNPEPRQIALSLAMLFAPALLAVLVQRIVNRRMERRR